MARITVTPGRAARERAAIIEELDLADKVADRVEQGKGERPPHAGPPADR